MTSLRPSRGCLDRAACGVTLESHLTSGVEHDLAAVPFTLISLALGVFLGFRNDTSYDRYWEGRKLWGRLVNDARGSRPTC